jgi:predicted DsbA family dithiol-disulfide isomerase
MQRLTLFFDYLCPFCYTQMESLRAIWEDDAVMVDWKGWKMPDGLLAPPKPEGYREAAKAGLERLLAETGLPYRPPVIRPDTKKAQIGTKIAAQEGNALAFIRRVFHLHFAEGQDISAKDVLIRAAEETGMDGQAFACALEAPEWEQAVRNDWNLAKKWQITTIPSYAGPRGTILVHHFNDLPSLEDVRAIL